MSGNVDDPPVTIRKALPAIALACVAVAGCNSGGSGRAVKQTTPTTTAPWQPPAAGVYVPVAEIPPPSLPMRDNVTFMWTAAAQACREYDAAHGTSTSITVETDPESPHGRPVSDTTCIPAHAEGSASAYAL